MDNSNTFGSQPSSNQSSVDSNFVIPPITEEERANLAKQQQEVVTAQLVYFIMSIFSILLFIGIILTPITYLSYKKALKLKKDIETSELPVQTVSGVLDLKYGGSKFSNGGISILSLNDFKLPRLISVSADAELKKYKGQNITAEYIPSVKMNRRCYDNNGNGYSFTLEKALQNFQTV